MVMEYGMAIFVCVCVSIFSLAVILGDFNLWKNDPSSDKSVCATVQNYTEVSMEKFILGDEVITPAPPTPTPAP